MKACAVALTCLPWLLPVAWTAKIARKSESSLAPNASHQDGLALLKEGVALHTATRKRTSRDDPSCPGNVMPDVNITVQGIGYLEDVMTGDVQTELQATLAGDPEWVVGKPWHLSMLADSNEHTQDHEFGFPGAGGYLVFTVPAQSLDLPISVTDHVEAVPGSVRLEYRGKAVITTQNAVTLKKICLRPVTCDWFFDGAPTMCVNDDFWVRKPNPSAIQGHTRDACCERRMCAAEDPCKPATKFSKRPDYDNATGSTFEECCIPVPCVESICNSSLWQMQPGDVFGSTREECCTPRDCKDHGCSTPTKWSKKPHQKTSDGEEVFMQGSTDEECCDSIPCSSFNCSMTDKWEVNLSATTGSTYEECCAPLWCDNYTCTPSTEWLPDPEAVLGSTGPSCCTPKLCSNFTCNATHQLRAGAVTGDKSLRGSTNDECCEEKRCIDYQCSDWSKWVRKSAVTRAGLDRRGSSDEACCEPLRCSNVECEPETLWARKSDEDLQGLQGNSASQCCDVRWCSTHRCTGDYPELNKSSTTWYKKKDTNHYKFRGSTDEECCHPIYCSQFFTKFPTKFERLPENLAKPRQGSTEGECYRPLVCIDHCCVDEFLKKKADARAIFGSTDAECCEKRTDEEI